MARTIQAIQKEMFDAIAADENLTELNSTSMVAIYRLFVFIVAFSNWVMENLFDTHKKEVEDIIQNDKAHRPSWYRTKAKAFQYGFALIPDTDKFNNTGYTDEQIEASKIIKYSAITKNAGQLLIKIAAESGGVLSPIEPEQYASFSAYMKEIADCGVKYVIVNILPDILLLNIRIYHDSLVLNDDGMHKINANYPVQDAINEYMKELPFDGELVLQSLVDKLQKAEGVKIVDIVNAESQAIDLSTGDYLAPQPITVKTVPVSGYFSVPNFDNITYVV